MSDTIALVVRPNRIFKAPNPIVIPAKDDKSYKEKVDEHAKVESELPEFFVVNMLCDSGIIVDEKVLNFHEGKKYNARVIKGNKVQII